MWFDQPHGVSRGFHLAETGANAHRLIPKSKLDEALVRQKRTRIQLCPTDGTNDPILRVTRINGLAHPNRINMSSSDDETISINGDAQRQSSFAHSPLQRVGDYELLEIVAQGGMGVVYRARQVSLNRIVAVKMIRQIEFASETDRVRFQSRSRSCGCLESPKHQSQSMKWGSMQGNPTSV